MKVYSLSVPPLLAKDMLKVMSSPFSVVMLISKSPGLVTLKSAEFKTIMSSPDSAVTVLPEETTAFLREPSYSKYHVSFDVLLSSDEITRAGIFPPRDAVLT